MVGVPIRSRRASVAVAALTALLVSGCSGDPARPGPTPGPAGTSAGPSAPAPTPTGDPATRAAALVGTLSDEDLVGQVLMPYAYGDSATKVSAAPRPATRPWPAWTPRPR
ncbi:hypothetical protein GCM10027614_29560 [Micromonospora vulcania]